MKFILLTDQKPNIIWSLQCILKSIGKKNKVLYRIQYLFMTKSTTEVGTEQIGKVQGSTRNLTVNIILNCDKMNYCPPKRPRYISLTLYFWYHPFYLTLFWRLQQKSSKKNETKLM
jgi:hypothetical protein